jgi:type III restriction enzyme
MDELSRKYEGIYLLRNEGHFAIYDFAQGRPFQPDFVLFLKEKKGEFITYQLYIEPKGKFLKENDKWKEIFLEQITKEFGSRVLKYEKSKFSLIGIPFYNNEDENIFKENLNSVLR